MDDLDGENLREALFEVIRLISPHGRRILIVARRSHYIGRKDWGRAFLPIVLYRTSATLLN